MDERNYSLESTLKFKALKKPDTREGQLFAEVEEFAKQQPKFNEV